ncbi:MAG: hypothetical protein CSA10_00920 [Cardiobacteriales bacterium]|nr:MAG: hypothetical protein CSA10_00920 [Cardiobacteriales bacterium]
MLLFHQYWVSMWQKRGPKSWRWIKFMPFALVRAYLKERLPEDAQAMVYITLLTLVPLLAVAFALLRGFGVEGLIEPWLNELFAPMGSAGNQVSSYLIEFVGQTRAGGLGIVGIVFLFISVINLAQKIETTLNRVWNVEDNRGIQSRITGYISAILLAPLLIGAIMTTMLSVKDAAWLKPFLAHSGINTIFNILTSALPIFLIFVVIACSYAWIPNIKVKWRAAFAGSVFFLALWYPISQIFSIFIAGSANYSVIYSSFATIVILLLWLFFLWLLFLMGAKVASLVQMPYGLSPKNEDNWYADEQILIGFSVMNEIARAFTDANQAPSALELSNAIYSTPKKVNFVLARLEKANMVTITTGNPSRYLLTKDVKHYNLTDIYRALSTPCGMLNLEEQHLALLNEQIMPILDKPLLEWLKNDKNNSRISEKHKTNTKT